MSRNRRVLTFLAAAALALTVLLPTRGATAPADGPVPRLDSVQVDKALEEIAAALARTVQEPGVRVLLKKEIGRQLDGDYEALVKTLASQKFGDGSTFLGKLTAGHGKAKGLDAAGARQSLNTHIARVPDLQIALPVHFDKWNPAAQAPLVAFAPIGIDDSKIKTIKAFDAQGRLRELDAQTPPAEPVLVVGINERTRKMTSKTPRIGVVKVTSHEMATTTTALAAHQYGEKEILGTIRITNDHEPWHKGKPEIYAQGAFPGKPDVVFLLDMPGVDDQNRTYTLNAFLFYWDQILGTNFAMSVWERDGSYLSTPFDFSCASQIMRRRQYQGGFDSDDALGCNLVHFSHTAGQIFTTDKREAYYTLTWAPAP